MNKNVDDFKDIYILLGVVTTL